MKVHVIYNPNAKNRTEVRVHRQGCSDIARELKQHPTSHYETEDESQQGIAEDFFADFIEEESMTREDALAYTDFLPCTEGLPPERAPEQERTPEQVMDDRDPRLVEAFRATKAGGGNPLWQVAAESSQAGIAARWLILETAIVAAAAATTRGPAATVVTSEEYGDEFTLRLANGNTIRTDTFADHPDGASYVRICGPAGNELAYWSCHEWRDDPEEVMGALLGAAGGAGRSGADSAGGPAGTPAEAGSGAGDGQGRPRQGS